jgi:hypothetical protein
LLADGTRPFWRIAEASCSLPRNAEKKNPITLAPAMSKSAACNPEMKGAAAEAERPRETPEKISTITFAGMALVTTAMAKAMESTAPTLTTRVLVPLATPRFSGATEPMMALVLGELKMPEPAPTTTIHRAISQ